MDGTTTVPSMPLAFIYTVDALIGLLSASLTSLKVIPYVENYTAQSIPSELDTSLASMNSMLLSAVILLVGLGVLMLPLNKWMK